MSTTQSTDITDAITPNIYLNSEVIGKVCLLSAEKQTSVPTHDVNDDDITSVPDEVIHCSLPNLSPIHHGNQSSVHHHRRYCNLHRPCTICYSNVSMVNGNNGSSQSISAYCSPRAGRKHRPGSYSTKDLSSLRAECYLKCKQQKGSRIRLDSGDSVDSDHGTLDSISHISTCATSDYAYMTSMDTIAMLCKECQKCQTDCHQNNDNLTPALSELDLCTSLRRTHSNPENCKINDVDDETDGDETQLQNIRDAQSCSELNDVVSAGINKQSPFGTDKSATPVKTTGFITTKGMQNKDSFSSDVRCLDKKKQNNKSIAISEENLVSRVSRWLSTVENGDALESDIF